MSFFDKFLYPTKKPSDCPEGDVAVQGRSYRVSDHCACAGACIGHSAGEASALGLVLGWIRIRVSMMAFFFVISVCKTPSSTYFPLFKLANRLGSTPDSSRHRSSISPPRNHLAFSFAKHVRFEHSIRSPSLIITWKREEKHPDKRQPNDQTKTFSTVRSRSVLSCSSP